MFLKVAETQKTLGTYHYNIKKLLNFPNMDYDGAFYLKECASKALMRVKLSLRVKLLFEQITCKVGLINNCY